MNPNFITLEDLGVAYRKAKVDLFYERGHHNLFALLDYEQHLAENLSRLHKQLSASEIEGWMTDDAFVGTWSVIAKTLDAKAQNVKRGSWRFSSPDQAWDASVQMHLGSSVDQMSAGRDRPTAHFRLVGVHPIDMHVVGALWMLKVGRLYDAALGPEAYGSRLRANDPLLKQSVRRDHARLLLGSFRPYLAPFRQWRDKGLAAMRKALDEGKRIVAITADARQFYHRVDPAFLLEPAYLDGIGVDRRVKPDHRRFTAGLISALHSWSERAPAATDPRRHGLPVGFPAARLIANVALAELDRVVVREVAPLYYGRYVDDLLIVLEDTSGFSSQEEVWRHLAKRVGGILTVESNASELAVRVRRPYLHGSDIQFVGAKQKIFMLEGVSGQDLVGEIDRQVRAQASEWRSLPELPDSPVTPPFCAVRVRNKDGQEVDSLRDADELSARRAEFAIGLRDAEAFARDLPPEAWAEHRQRFFSTIETYLLALPALFDFEAYLPRVVGLAVACGDYAAACSILKRLHWVIERLARDCRVQLLDEDGSPELLMRWREQLGRGLAEACAASVPLGAGSVAGAISRLIDRLNAVGVADGRYTRNTNAFQSCAKQLFRHDLGRVPYRYSFFPYSNVYGFDAASIDAKKPLLRAEHYGLVPEVSRSGVQSFLEAIHENPDTNGLPIALLFPTRPFVIPEFYLVVPALFTARPKGDAAAWARAFRGLDLRRLPRRTGDTIHVDFRSVDRRLRIGLASWETSRESWKAAAATVRDPDVSRYGRLNRLLNEALHSAARPRYLILPELAMPPQWFFGIASRLAASGVSLVSGVEYLPSGGGSVANQVWVSLVADFPNYRTFVVYRQDKQRAALHEESELWAVGGKRLVPETRYNAVPRIRHGDFLFATLVCSELTDIRRRASLRGRIDALFVPEWNQDTETFSALVESAALDVHAYIIQCNDRAFGDTRIRAPAREPWARDVVKVKGGVSDYLVVGEIDVESLRRFQSHHRSPVGPACDKIKFKPVPDGFEISADRRRLPG